MGNFTRIWVKSNIFTKPYFSVDHSGINIRLRGSDEVDCAPCDDICYRETVRKLIFINPEDGNTFTCKWFGILRATSRGRGDQAWSGRHRLRRHGRPRVPRNCVMPSRRTREMDRRVHIPLHAQVTITKSTLKRWKINYASHPSKLERPLKRFRKIRRVSLVIGPFTVPFLTFFFLFIISTDREFWLGTGTIGYDDDWTTA